MPKRNLVEMLDTKGKSTPKGHYPGKYPKPPAPKSKPKGKKNTPKNKC